MYNQRNVLLIAAGFALAVGILPTAGFAQGAVTADTNQKPSASVGEEENLSAETVGHEQAVETAAQGIDHGPLWTAIGQHFDEEYPWLKLMPEVSGYVQVRGAFIRDTQFDTNDSDRFDVLNARVRFQSRHPIETLIGKLRYKLDFDVAAGALDMKDMWMEFEPHSAFRIRIGQFRVPLGDASILSDARQMFIDKAGVAAMVFGRDAGIMVHGAVAANDSFGIRYAAGIWNGEGRNVFRNPNQAFMGGGRLLIDLFGGTGALHNDIVVCDVWLNSDKQCEIDQSFRLTLGGAYILNPDNARGELYEQTRRDQRWSAEVHAKAYGFVLHGEFMRGFIDQSGTNVGFERRAYYGAFGYNPAYLPWMEIVYRYEWFDNDRSASQFTYENQARTLNTAGVNLYFLGHDAKLQIDYVLTDLQEGVTTSPEGDPLFGDRVRLQLQAGF